MQKVRWRRLAGRAAGMLACLCVLVCTGCVVNGLQADSRIVMDVNVSNHDIEELKVEGSDYILIDNFATACLQQGKQMASLGTVQDGMYFDGKTAYRYLNGEVMPMDDFPFDRIAERLDGYLHAVQAILQDGYFWVQRRIEPETSGSIYEGQFYYVISEEGMAFFADEGYANGLIISRYRSTEFQQAKLFLFGPDGQLRTRCEIGKLEQGIDIEPPK